MQRYQLDFETEIKHDDVNAVIYLAQLHDKFQARGYSGKRNKPDFYINFKSEDNRNIYVNKWLESLKKRQEEKQERRKERSSFVHNVKVGDIFYCSWGYEQTNVDFYQVLEIIGKNTVKIKQLSTVDVGNEQGHFMSATKIPVKDQFLTYHGKEEKELIKRVQPGYRNQPYIKLSSYEYLNLWDGLPKNYSWYA